MKKTTNPTNTHETTTTTTFADLLHNYEVATRNKETNPTAYANTLQELATACTYSVLKKLSSVRGKVDEGKKAKGDSGHIFRTMRNELTADLYNLKDLDYAVNNSTRMTFDKDGDYVQEVTDRHLWDAIPTLLDNVLNDGLDLVNTAICAIMDETEKAKDLTANFMETPYTTRRLKKKVYIQSIDSVGGWEEVETTPIQEVYKAIRREVQASRQIQATSKYTYLAEVVKDTETEVYKRLPKYSGLAYEINTDGTRTSFDGIITADETTTKDTEVLIEKLNLTDRQVTILNLRLSGKGYKAIGTYLGIRSDSVRDTMESIQKKAVKIGLTPLDK
jgi:hypothetical protein